MQELSLHILDIAKNSVKAGASLIEIAVRVLPSEDRLEIEIVDNGCGMDEKFLQSVVDPFSTTRTTRKVGMGIPLLKQACEVSGGGLQIFSKPNEGTRVCAHFGLSSIDRMPLGDYGFSAFTLFSGSPHIDFIFAYQYDQNKVAIDTREIKEVLGDMPIDSMEVTEYLLGYFKENFLMIDGGKTV